MDIEERRVILVLADISGYTRFMVQNQVAAVHSQQCINFLIETLIREVDIPLVLQEIEGDAVFLWASPDGIEAQWSDVVAEIQAKLERFFEAFMEKMVIGGEASPCACAFCRESNRLKLKLVVHSGRAVFSTVVGRRQVTGVDVILAHRLLKNSIPGDEYLLMTDAAFRGIGSGMRGPFVESSETYDQFGRVRTHVRFARGDREAFLAGLYGGPVATMLARCYRYIGWAVVGQTRAGWLRVEEAGSLRLRVGRFVFALLLTVTLPVMLLLLAVAAPVRLLYQRTRHRSDAASLGAP